MFRIKHVCLSPVKEYKEFHESYQNLRVCIGTPNTTCKTCNAYQNFSNFFIQPINHQQALQNFSRIAVTHWNSQCTHKNILSCHHNRNQWWKRNGKKCQQVSRRFAVFMHHWWNSQHHANTNHQTPLTTTALGSINHEYCECSQESCTSVGNPNLKLILDFRQCLRKVSCTATGFTANSTNVFKTHCTLHKVACVSFCNIRVNAVQNLWI